MLELHDCEQCTACDLALTRQRVVISRGAASARLMLIGEAPGAREDALSLIHILTLPTSNGV